MSFPIRPDKLTCAGLVGILMVLPSSIWKNPDAQAQPGAKPKKIQRNIDSAHHSIGLETTNPSM